MQLRGDKLKLFLQKSLLDLIGSCDSAGKKFIYSQKSFSAHAGVSRQTVRLHQDMLDEILEEQKVRKCVIDKDARLSKLESRLSKLSHELDQVTKSYIAIRKQYLVIFEVLIQQSFDVTKLASAIDKRMACDEAVSSQCPVCAQLINYTSGH